MLLLLHMTLETDVCVLRYAPIVVLATQEEEEEFHWYRDKVYLRLNVFQRRIFVLIITRLCHIYCSLVWLQDWRLSRQTTTQLNVLVTELLQWRNLKLGNVIIVKCIFSRAQQLTGCSRYLANRFFRRMLLHTAIREQICEITDG